MKTTFPLFQHVYDLRRRRGFVGTGRVGRAQVGSLTIVLVMAGAVACGPSDGAGSGARGIPGDTASMYAERLMEVLGGHQAWERARYLRFRWVVDREGEIAADRTHSWDRYEGRYRLEYDVEDGHLLALFNEKTFRQDPELGKVPAGEAWRNGVALAGLARDSALASAFRTFINDSYWLLMPFKWLDEGVHLQYEGRRVLPDGGEYAVVRLDFEEGLGVIEDRYRAYLDPVSGALAAWQYHLQGNEEPGPVIWWEEWTPVGGILLSMARRTEGGGTRIRFEDVVVSASVPAGEFDPPVP